MTHWAITLVALTTKGNIIDEDVQMADSEPLRKIWKWPFLGGIMRKARSVQESQLQHQDSRGLLLILRVR